VERRGRIKEDRGDRVRENRKKKREGGTGGGGAWVLVGEGMKGGRRRRKGLVPGVAG